MKYNNPVLSIIIPCYNEAGNITILFEQILRVMCDIDYSFEVIFVDDGSGNETLSRIKELRHAHSVVRYITFTRNFGHQKALLAGIRAACGEAVVTMDADLQHPISLLTSLLEQWNNGCEVVNIIRTDSSTVFFKRITLSPFCKLLNMVTGLGLEPGSADFRLLNRNVVDIIAKSKENDLFLRGLICKYGFRQTSINYVADA